MEAPTISSSAATCEPTASQDLLDVGKNINDPLLIRKAKPFRMPPSSVLSQVKSFLPMMQQANCELEERLKTIPPEDVDIENTADCQEKVIEMNLALFAEDDSSSDEDDEIADDADDSSDSDIDAHGTLGEVNATNIKLPNQCRNPKRTMVVDVTGDAEVKGHDLGSEAR